MDLSCPRPLAGLTHERDSLERPLASSHLALRSQKDTPALCPGHALAKAMDAAGQVLGHGSTLHGLHAHLLQSLCEPVGVGAEGDPSCARPRPKLCPWATSGPSLITYLMRSWVPSSFPRCSRPRVQAKMLAIGLVLVGRPWGEGPQGSRAEYALEKLLRCSCPPPD